MGADQRREFQGALLDAEHSRTCPAKWQATVVAADQNRPNLRVVHAGIRTGHVRGSRLLARPSRSIARFSIDAVAQDGDRTFG
jgi:hypothetical protein